MTTNLGRTLLVANPMAQNGNGAAAARRAAQALRASLGDESFSMAFTESAGRATDLAAQAGSYDTVLALGGDGLVHEVANGLMRLPGEARPALGVIPVGSGNDYARTLGMPESLDEAVRLVLGAPHRLLDIGRCNAEYFVETLSFGLDAAIALDTMKRRRRSRLTGCLLYAASGIDQLAHHLVEYHFEAHLDGGRLLEGSMFLFAVQIGPTYGGGFRICPAAQPSDGLFDLCIAQPPLSLPRATCIFLMAKNGWHARSKQVAFHKAATLDLQFEKSPPVQVDGEPITGERFHVEIVPQALRVLSLAG